MSDLTEFLLARIAEDEAVALAWGSSGPSRHLREGTRPPYLDPTRVLAECEAKRRIVMEFEQVHADYRIAPTPTMEGQRFGLAKAVAALAGVYADHPDYRPEWRP